MSQEDLVSSFGRKVLFCSHCDTEYFTGLEIEEITSERGKKIKLCPYCAEPLHMRSEASIRATRDARPVMRSASDAPRSTVIRLFTTPWGKVKMYLSVHSYFAPWVVSLDRVLVTREKNYCQFVTMEPAKPNQKESESVRFLPMPAIKRLIDEEFSAESMFKSMDELKCEPLIFMEFVNRLAVMIKAIHLDPKAPAEMDLDLVSV